MEYEVFSAAFLSALCAIVLMDLVLAGDNALIIGIVARDLPKENQRKVVIYGAVGAIAVRATMAVLVVYALNVPGFMLAGGIALVWIARKMLSPDHPDGASSHGVKAPARTTAGAIRTIIAADAIMGVDNVLAIGGAAHGSVLLVVLGLAISVPIVIWGSHLVIRLVDRYPSVVLLGGVVLAWTAYSMVVREPMLARWLESNGAAKPIIAILIFSISLGPWCLARVPKRTQPFVFLAPAPPIWVLAFEMVSNAWGLQTDGLLARNAGNYLLVGVRWLGWLPLAASYLWLHERSHSRTRCTSRTTSRHSVHLN